MIGRKARVAPLDTITREAHGVVGTIEKKREFEIGEKPHDMLQATWDWHNSRRRAHNPTKYFLRFDEVTKLVGARVTGLWLEEHQFHLIAEDAGQWYDDRRETWARERSIFLAMKESGKYTPEELRKQEAHVDMLADTGD